MKKVLSLILVAMMLLPGFALAEDKVEFTYMAVSNKTFEEGGYIETYIEENVPGIDIKHVFIDYTDHDALALNVGAGEMADFAWFNMNYLPAYMKEQEIIEPIPVELFRKYAPSWAALYDQTPISWALSLDPEDPTQLIGLNGYQDAYALEYIWGNTLRYDWLVASGVDVSSMNIKDMGNGLYAAEKGMTLDQLWQYLDYMVNGDPDGNGVADTVGFNNDYLRMVSSVGLFKGVVEQPDGSAAPYYVHPNMKKFLQWMQDAYAANLIYKEIFTIQWGQDWEMLNSGITGIQGGGMGFSFLLDDTRPPKTLLDKGIPVLVFPGICDENGNTYDSMILEPGYTSYLYAAKGVTEEQIIAFLRFAEFAYFGNGDFEKFIPVRYGQEGVDFEWDENGYPTKIADGLWDQGIAGYFCGDICVGQNHIYSNLKPGTYYSSIYDEYITGVWAKDRCKDYKLDLYVETDATAIKNEYGADWDQIRNAYFMAVIRGEKNLEADWDTYIQDLNDASFDEYLEELNKVRPLQEILAELAK